MADVFQDGDKITSEFLNKVSKTVTDGCGDKTTPTDVRLFIGAEKAGAAGDVQTSLDAHKADSSIHFPDAPNDTKDYVRGQGTWKEAALTEAPIDNETYGRRNGAWSVVSGTGASDHQALANRSAIDAHPISSITDLSSKHATYDAHLANILNPHQVTAAQVGADPTGSASTVQGNLDTHTANASNPHSVTASQVGADTSSEVDGKITTHLNTAPHIPDVTEAGKQFTRTTNGWEEAAGANVVEYSLITATSAGTVEADLDATDFTGHPYAGANTYVTVETNHVVTVAHGADLYKYIGSKPKNLGLGGDATTSADYLQSGSSDHSALTNRSAVDSHPTAAITGLDTALSGKSDTSHLHTGVYDPAGTGQAAADVVQGNLDTHTSNVTNPHSVTAAQVGADPTGSAASVQSNLDTHAGTASMHIGHATNDGNPYVSFEGAWALLSDHITPPAVETDHTQMTNRDQPNQHSIGSVGTSGGTQLQDELDRIDAEVALKANQAALVAHAGDTTIHFSDTPASDGIEYVRKNRAWVQQTAGTGDLKSDGSVQMAGAYTPTLAQDIATKGYSDTTSVQKSGDTMTGQLTLAGNSAGALQAVTKQEMDAAISSGDDAKVSKSGDTMTGALILNADATADLGAVTKQQLDANFNNYLDGHLNTNQLQEFAGDLDTKLVNGDFYIVRDSCTNVPAMYSFGMLSVRTRSTGIVIQTINDRNRTYYREKWSTTWSSWARQPKLHNGTTLPATTNYAEGDVFIVTA